MTSKEALSQQLSAYKAVAYKLKHKNEGLDIETIDHIHKWVMEIIEVIEYLIQKQDMFDDIKQKVVEKEGDLVFPFVERTKVDD